MGRNGLIWIFYGGENLSTTSNQHFYGETNETLGGHISIGDLNGDSYSDIVAYRTNPNNMDDNIIVYKGSPEGLELTDLSFNPDKEKFTFDCSGDYDGDGKKELILTFNNVRVRIYYFDQFLNVDNYKEYTKIGGSE